MVVRIWEGSCVQQRQEDCEAKIHHAMSGRYAALFRATCCDLELGNSVGEGLDDGKGRDYAWKDVG